MAIDAIGLTPSASSGLPTNAGISQEEFLRILLTQLRFQDPLKPVDNEQFVAQLAQFSALEINREQSEKIDSLLTIQATNQAVGLIGKSVEVGSTAGAALGNATSVGTVSAISFSTGAPLLTVTGSNSSVLTDVKLSDVQLVR